MNYSRLLPQRAVTSVQSSMRVIALPTVLFAGLIGTASQAIAQQPTAMETMTITASGIERQLAKTHR